MIDGPILLWDRAFSYRQVNEAQTTSNTKTFFFVVVIKHKRKYKN